jgi:hypothetical protein
VGNLYFKIHFKLGVLPLKKHVHLKPIYQF